MLRQSRFHSHSALSAGRELWEAAVSHRSELSHLLGVVWMHLKPQKAKLQLLELQLHQSPEQKKRPQSSVQGFSDVSGGADDLKGKSCTVFSVLWM